MLRLEPIELDGSREPTAEQMSATAAMVNRAWPDGPAAVPPTEIPDWHAQPGIGKALLRIAFREVRRAMGPADGRTGWLANGWRWGINTIDEAEDLAIGILADLIGGYRPGALSLESWVRRQFRNRLSNAYRAAQAQCRHVPSCGEPIPDVAGPAPAVDAAGRIALGMALGQLPPSQRRVIVMRYIGEWSWADIAQATGRDPRAVQRLAKRALGRMREALNDPAVA